MSCSNKKNNLIYYLLIFSGFFTYIVLTGSKNLYIAEKTTMYDLGIFGNLSSLASTMEYYFYSYAVMQVLIIFFIKKVNIKWFLTITLGISAILTSIMSFTTTIISHYVIYTANGFLQAGVWGCTLKILSKYLPNRLLPLASSLMNTGPATAGIISYGVAAAFGENWSFPFLLLGIILLALVLLFYIATMLASKISTEKTFLPIDESSKEGSTFLNLNSNSKIVAFYAFSILVGLLGTIIYFIVNNNLDVYLKQIGGLSNDLCKLLTVLAPICTVIGPLITVKACEKTDNFILVAGITFSVSLVLIILTLLLYNTNVYLGLTILILFLIASNGARMIVMTITSLKMRNVIDTGMYATSVNAVSSIFVGLAPKLASLILDNKNLSTTQSWSLIFIITAVVNLILVAILFSLVFYVNRRKKLKTL